MNCGKLLHYLFIFLLFGTAQAQSSRLPKGKLFIIGGGDRPPAMMKRMVSEAALAPTDYIAVLPMSSEQPDTGYHYFKLDLETVCSNPILNFNFTADRAGNQASIDSLKKARLIFITGGDQERFMNAIRHTPVLSAIQAAYANGALVAGTSAGAAVMSRYMITGRERTDTVYRATFRKLENDNLETQNGLGLLQNAIIDQHFVVRSRYNRLLSAIAQFPRLTCIGIDEATAIIVHQNNVTVTGEGQVIVLKDPRGLAQTDKKLIRLKDLSFSILTDGDHFTLQPAK